MSKWDTTKKFKPKADVVKEHDPICRIVPPILARDIDVLDLIVAIPPVNGFNNLPYEIKRRMQKVSDAIREKFSSQDAI